jgi:beta-lactamase superfamily II metal-dependent hydrolase
VAVVSVGPNRYGHPVQSTRIANEERFLRDG